MNRPTQPAIPQQAGELEMLSAFLDYYRAELIDRAWALDDAQMQITLAPSDLSIGRLISHMIMVEDIWFRVRLLGLEPSELFASLDWDADTDAEMTLSATWTRSELLAHFDAAVADSRQRVAAAASLEDLSVVERDGERWSLRWILVHMIEEYARHCGHADLIRESIDGDTAR